MSVLDLAVLCVKVTAYVVGGLLLVAFMPGIPPNIDVDVIEYSTARELEGSLAPNNILDKAELFLKDEIQGAESIAVDGDTLYFGAHGGIVYKYNGSLIRIAQTGQPCDKNIEIHSCGVPLGIRFDNNKQLVIADAFVGLLKLNPETGTMQTIVPIGTIIRGLPVSLPNDLDIGTDGSIYWTDATQLSLQDIVAGLLCGRPRGRLIKTDPKTGNSQVLISDLLAANGVQLAPNEEFVLVSELLQHRVLRYYLKGEKKGSWDVFVDRLPGSPDNIRPNGKGGYYIALALPRDEATESLGQYPTVRRLIIRIFSFVQTVTKLLQHVYPKNYEDMIANFIFSSMPSGKVIIVETDGDGQIIGSLQNDKSEIRMVSQATLGSQYLYMGTPRFHGIYRLKRSELLR